MAFLGKILVFTVSLYFALQTHCSGTPLPDYASVPLTEFTNALLDKCGLLQAKNRNPAEKKALQDALAEMEKKEGDDAAKNGYLSALRALSTLIVSDMRPRVERMDPYNRRVRRLVRSYHGKNGRDAHQYMKPMAYFGEIFPEMREMIKNSYEGDGRKKRVLDLLHSQPNFAESTKSYFDALTLAFLGANASEIAREMFNLKYELLYGYGDELYQQNQPNENIQMPKFDELERVIKKRKYDANEERIRELESDTERAVRTVGKTACYFCEGNVLDRTAAACVTGCVPNIAMGGIFGGRAIYKAIVNGHKVSKLEKENQKLYENGRK